MKVLKFFSLLVVLFFFSQCHYHEDFHDEYIWTEYIETKCADPWGTNESDSSDEVKDAIKDYFDPVDIASIRITFDEDYAQDCEACVCTSGRVIEVKVRKCFDDVFEDEAFTKK